MDGIEIIDPETYPMLDTFCRYYAKRRAKKGMTVSEARDILLKDYIFFAACLVAFDIADGMVAGAVATSSEVIRAALQVIGPHPGLSTVSSSFIMITDKPQFGDDGIFVIGDCSVVIEPTPQQLADIAVSCVERARRTAQTLDPKVAFLSYSTMGSGAGEEVERVREAVRLLRDRNVDFEFRRRRCRPMRLSYRGLPVRRRPVLPLPVKPMFLYFPISFREIFAIKFWNICPVPRRWVRSSKVLPSRSWIFPAAARLKVLRTSLPSAAAMPFICRPKRNGTWPLPADLNNSTAESPLKIAIFRFSLILKNAETVPFVAAAAPKSCL